MMNCIIVDDDSFIRKIIEDFVKKTSTLNLLHSLSSAIEAANVLNSGESIDLIFLDVEMPEMTGIEFLCSLTASPQIIIISSKEKYAIDAFEFDVTDYLLKPITYCRFSKAVKKAMDRQKSKTHHATEDEFFIKHSHTLVKIKYSDILWVEAMENYIVINTFDEKYTMHFTMRAFEEKLLPNKHFLRVHRSFIVNIAGIHSISEKTINIVTKGSSVNSIPIGKMYKDKLLKEINVIVKK